MNLFNYTAHFFSGCRVYGVCAHAMAFALYARISPHSTTSYRMTGGHNSCPMPHSAPFRPNPPPYPNGVHVHRLRPGQQLLQLQLDTTCYSCLLCRCIRVCVCVLNIAIYHANAFFNFNMPPGIIKTLQTHNMSQEPRVVEKRHGGKLSPQMMRYHMLHGKKH